MVLEEFYLFHMDILWSTTLDLGSGLNNWAELNSLLILLRLASETEIQNLQIYGDSQFVIDLVNGKNKLQTLLLEPVFNQVRDLTGKFNHCSCTNVYREFNQQA